jgi:hypothetical protein
LSVPSSVIYVLFSALLINFLLVMG